VLGRGRLFEQLGNRAEVEELDALLAAAGPGDVT
jgi:hypothetical protein